MSAMTPSMTDKDILALAADHHLPVRFPHELLAFARALLERTMAPHQAAIQDNAAETSAAPDAALYSTRAKARRYEWLAARFIGYDYFWGGHPLAENEADRGKCVIVIEVGQNFRGGRDLAAAIDAALAAGDRTPTGDAS